MCELEKKEKVWSLQQSSVTSFCCHCEYLLKYLQALSAGVLLSFSLKGDWQKSLNGRMWCVKGNVTLGSLKQNQDLLQHDPWDLHRQKAIQ